MWFTRQSRTVRVWFQAVASTGRLRTGLDSGSFTATVIDADDSTSVTPSVSESVQRPGNYYFDIPSPFFVANGTGDYNVSIEIDSIAAGGTAPHVRSAMSDVLQVSQEDFDTVSGSIWSTQASQFDVTGTMGYLENQIASISFSSSLDVNQVVSGVWNANAASFDVTGTMGYLENTLSFISSSVQFIQDVEAGTWVITGSQMVLYTSGTGDELARFDLRDINGLAIDPSTQNPFQRVRV